MNLSRAPVLVDHQFSVKFWVTVEKMMFAIEWNYHCFLESDFCTKKIIIKKNPEHLFSF